MSISNYLTHHDECKDALEVPIGESLTVPDQCLSIREILRRSGVIDSGFSVYYEENPDHENVDPTTKPDFDLSDVTEISQEISMRSARRKAEAEALREAALADEQKAKAKAEAEAQATEVKKT